MASERDSRKKFEEINKVEGFSPATLVVETENEAGDKSKYLPVRERISWFRLAYPKGTISTELIKIAEALGKQSIVKATVADGERTLGTGYGSAMCNIDNNFGTSHIECAETKAIGRALSAAGFGTQFSDDYDLPEGEVVDSGVPVKNPEAKTEEKTKAARKSSKSAKAAESVPAPVSDSEKVAAEEPAESASSSVNTQKKVTAEEPTKAVKSVSENETGEQSDEEQRFNKKVKMLVKNITPAMSKGISITYGPEPHKTIAETYKEETNEDKLFTIRKLAYPETIDGANPSIVAACRVFIDAAESAKNK